MELKRLMRWGAGGVVVVGLMLLIAFSYDKILNLGEDSFSILFENFVLSAISIYLMTFLALLIIRYAVMILYSFMEHLEYLLKRRREADPTDFDYREEGNLPMISLVVPAYNEGPVIQPAVR